MFSILGDSVILIIMSINFETSIFWQSFSLYWHKGWFINSTLQENVNFFYSKNVKFSYTPLYKDQADMRNDSPKYDSAEEYRYMKEKGGCGYSKQNDYTF